METPVTPKKARPKLQARSHTSSAALSSPPKESPPSNKDTSSPQDSKRHHHHHLHFDFFRHNNHHHPHNAKQGRQHRSQYSSPRQSHERDKRGEERNGTKITNLKQHVPNSVSEFTQMMATGANHVRGAGGDSVKSSSRRESREIPADLPTASRVPSQVVRPEDVEREKYRRKQQEVELHNAFDRLSDLAQRSTRRFDFIYYGTLEKVTRLHSLIVSLQELSKGSTQLRDDFKSETGNLVSEAQKQIDAFHDLTEQQKGVKALEARIEIGKKRTEKLSARLEEARMTAQDWEKGEKEWQARASKRLTIAQFFVSAVVVLVAVLISVRRYNHSVRDAGVRELDVLMNTSGLPPFIVEDLADIKSRRLAAEEQPSSSIAAEEETMAADRRLLGFDAL